MLSTNFIYEVFFIVTDIIATGWLLMLFTTVRVDPPGGQVRPNPHTLNWRNLLLTLCAGWLLSFGARTAELGDIIRYWRAITSLLVFFVSLMLIMGRIFTQPDSTTSAPLKFGSYLLGWLLLAMVLLTWARGFGS